MRSEVRFVFRSGAAVRLLSVLLLVATWGCGSEGSGTTPSATSPSDAAAVFDGRVVFYGAQAGDTAAGIVSGDFNGDGAKDIVFAASLADGPNDTRPDGGEVYVFTGPFRDGDTRDAGNGEQALTIYGASAGDQFGRVIAAGDVDGDRVDDILIGAPMGDGPAEDRPDSGEVHVIFGKATLGADKAELDVVMEASDLVVYGASGQDLNGYSVLAEDVSGDGTKDLIIGALRGAGPDDQRPDSGEVYVVNGSSELSGVIDLSTQPPDLLVWANAGDRLGEELSTGDVNGDGLHDLVLPATFAPGRREETEKAGQTHVIFSPPPARIDLSVSAANLTVYGVDAGDQFGHSLGAGDIDGDGFAELLLAAVSSSGARNEVRLAGEAAVMSGRVATGEDVSAVDVAEGDANTLSLIYGASPGDRLGRSATVGDVNGDGLADILVAAPGGDGAREDRSNIGEIYVILGAASLPRVVYLGTDPVDAILPGDDPDDTLGSETNGRPVLLVSDVNADGLGDALLGAPNGDGPDGLRTDAGEGYIVFASAHSR